MNEHISKRRDFSSWDEAFRALSPVVRQQSVRVAAYTQVLYVQACSTSFGTQTLWGTERMKGEYADYAYKCGLYHQLGKALVPDEYQLWNPGFSDEEKALYRKYTCDGRLLVAKLQDPSAYKKFKKTESVAEVPTNNITWLMLRESCEQHMERNNGSGYPDGRRGDEISVIAQIVGLAKELDRLVSQKISETPFDDAYITLVEQAGKAFSEELIEVFKAARGKCRAVYKKYIHYTNTLPKTIPLVDKRADRSMGLKYRPMLSADNTAIVAFEAVPWFAGVLGQPDERESLKDLEDMFNRTNTMQDIGMYLLYEAADAVLRLHNCKIRTEGVLLNMLGGFYEGESIWSRLEQLFMDQPIDKSRLKLIVPEDTLFSPDNQVKANLIQYIENGVCLVLDDYHPERVSIRELQEIGFTYVRIAPELYLSQETANHITVLKNYGITVLGKNADNHEISDWLKNSGAAYKSGTITGVMVTEDEMIRDMLSGNQ